MSDFAANLAAAVLLVFSVYRLSTDRGRAPDHVQHYGYCLMICLALAMAMLAPSMPGLLAALGMKPAAVILLGDTVRTAAMSSLMFMAYAVGQRPVRGLPVWTANVLGALCAALIVAATVVAKWHGAYSAARDRVQAYVIYRRLTPLWEAMHAELPQIALDDDRRVLLGDRSLDFALYRRVIEIHDGRLALRPYTPEPAARREALAEAAAIAVALENRRSGRVCASEGTVRRDEAARTLAVEAAWLAEVATAFARIQKNPQLGRDSCEDSPPSAPAGVYPD